jgi:hypothetical protein
MKANFSALALALSLAGCASAPKPAPAPPPVVKPAPPLLPKPVPLPPAPADWRDAPRSPGNWHWAREGALSVANYGSERPLSVPDFAMACDMKTRLVSLHVTIATPAPSAMIITTANLKRVFTAQPVPGLPVISVEFPASDPILDAMAFSRGRFMVEVPGRSPLYLPSWAEVSRVIEDCR